MAILLSGFGVYLYFGNRDKRASYDFDPATGGNRYVPDQDPPISVPGGRKLTAEEVDELARQQVTAEANRRRVQSRQTENVGNQVLVGFGAMGVGIAGAGVVIHYLSWSGLFWVVVTGAFIVSFGAALYSALRRR